MFLSFLTFNPFSRFQMPDGIVHRSLANTKIIRNKGISS